MPLFGRSQDTAPVEPAPVQTSNRMSTSSMDGRKSGGFFSRRKSSPSPDSSHSSLGRESSTRTSGSILSGGGGGLFSRNKETGDPAIIAARERVAAAEQAEREADRALMAARTSVHEAKEHARRLEEEAAEDARLAKIKQGQAKDISKRAKPLGRHDRF